MIGGKRVGKTRPHRLREHRTGKKPEKNGLKVQGGKEKCARREIALYRWSSLGKWTSVNANA